MNIQHYSIIDARVSRSVRSLVKFWEKNMEAKCSKDTGWRLGKCVVAQKIFKYAKIIGAYGDDIKTV